MPDSIRGNGDETQAIMEAIADIIAAFRGSSEWFAEWNLACSIWVPDRSTLLVVTVAPVRNFLPNIRTVKTQNGFVDPVTPLLFSEIKTISVYR